MNWNQIEGKWDQVKARFKQKWAKLTDDDLSQMKGRRDEIVGKLQERYGDKREKIEKEVDETVRSF